uniref:VAN3-binding protein-like n=1 Tax=Nicotiana tabacum TaxID=4097 RepID=A0A1S4B7Z7_TOBAC|nr:PREDICTED: VAN3-binding protein-like [Nicotiana tabacum]
MAGTFLCLAFAPLPEAYLVPARLGEPFSVLPYWEFSGVFVAEQLPAVVPGKSKNTLTTRPRRCFENSFTCYNHQSSEIASNAMQFLSRPWSPSSSDFLQMFSSSNNLLLKDTEDYDAEMLDSSSNRAITNKHYIKLDLHHMKGWLKSKSPFSFFRSSHQEKKEKLRLQTAKLHALLSLTQLASAISGFASNSSSGILDSQQINWSHNMGNVVASAAALMTTVCAEAAESLGAGRAQVASAVNSGLAIQTPMDMIAVTATAATCLRGAAILKSRALDHSSPRIPEMLTAGTRIWIIMPSGHKEDKWVTLHLKQNQLILSLKRKYFGALTTSKEYKLINIIRECFEAQDEYFVSLKTNNGIIKLLFKDETQSSIWISTISSVLISS